MSKFYRCDYCEKETSGDAEIELNGVLGTSGGILLPERYHKKTFCSPACFWSWAEKYKPDN
jgi:hypothetical protein